MSERLFNKVAGLQLSYEIAKFFKSSFFYETAFLGKQQQRCNRFIFLINTTE